METERTTTPQLENALKMRDYETPSAKWNVSIELLPSSNFTGEKAERL